jgi:hypothetical protein
MHTIFSQEQNKSVEGRIRQQLYNDFVPDYTRDTDGAVQDVRVALEAIFRCHGATELQPPLLSPVFDDPTPDELTDRA